MEYKPQAGESIKTCTERMVKVAHETNTEVTAKFNGIEIIATAGSVPAEIEKEYVATCRNRTEAYRKSDEHKKAKEAQNARQRERDLQFKYDSSKAPLTMSFASLEAERNWQKFQSSNKGSAYGNAILDYAQIWARLMEAKISQGKTVADCANETSRTADIEGVTGFMHGCAVSALAQTWKYGEALRQWYNLDTQIGNKDETANKVG